MINRRALISGIAGTTLLLRGLPTWAQEMSRAEALTSPASGVDSSNAPLDESLTQLEYPPFTMLDGATLFGKGMPSSLDIKRVKDIVDATPKGPTPIAIAQSFVDRFYDSNARAISQWPTPAAWNPLIVEFFRSTTLKANNDLVAWCAAFANWCLDRSGKIGSRSAASQSFLGNDFEKTSTPRIGDLAIFTCYRPGTAKSVGLGHVGFVASLPSANFVEVLGGNQSGDGHSSIISRKKYSIADRSVYRTVKGKRELCTMRLNTYVKVS